MKSRAWLTYALVTTASWGVWGAFTGLPANHGFPETLIYVVWAVTMIPPALFALRRVGWRLQRDPRSLCYGALIGLLGAGGQMLLFHAVRTGPAYLIFPVISLSPVVTVALSLALLHERTAKLADLEAKKEALLTIDGHYQLPVRLHGDLLPISGRHDHPSLVVQGYFGCTAKHDSGARDSPNSPHFLPPAATIEIGGDLCQLK